MAKKKTEIRVPNEIGEQIRITLNRDLNYNFTYTSPIGGKYTYFKFSNVNEKNKAYHSLQMWYYGKSLKKLRNSIIK